MELCGTVPVFNMSNILRYTGADQGDRAIKLLGIDVGTGGTRALLIDESGAVVASAIHEHEPFASPRSGWAEQDPHDWWKACQGAVRKLLAESGIPASEIACIGLSGQMHGAVLLDRNDEVLRPGAHLVRSAHRGGVPLSQRNHRARSAWWS